MDFLDVLMLRIIVTRRLYLFRATLNVFVSQAKSFAPFLIPALLFLFGIYLHINDLAFRMKVVRHIVV